MTKRSRGEGSIYLRGSTWWVAYYANSLLVRESSKSERERDAVALLRKRHTEVDTGQFAGPELRKQTFEDLVTVVKGDYAAKGRRSVRRVDIAVAHLKRVFAGQRASRITGTQLAQYLTARLASGAALSSVKYELAILKRGFRLAKVQRPEFPPIGEIENARQGFFERTDFERLCAELPDYLVAPARVAYFTGWRKQEVLGLTWDRVDLTVGIIRLDTSKNGEPRTFPIDALPQLEALLKAQRSYRDVVEAATGQTVRFVFHRFGKPIKDFYHAWRVAAKRAKVDGKIFHDLRRTAVRNLERARVPRSVATKLTGHKTEAVYKRYAIVSEADLREGVQKLASSFTVHAQSEQRE